MYSIEIKPSAIHGKGVFATNLLPKFTLLVCDVILISGHLITEEIKPYLYPWHRKTASLCLGFGSYFNHSNDPNTRIKRICDKRLIKEFEITKDILPGDELTINYGRHP